MAGRAGSVVEVDVRDVRELGAAELVEAAAGLVDVAEDVEPQPVELRQPLGERRRAAVQARARRGRRARTAGRA